MIIFCDLDGVLVNLRQGMSVSHGERYPYPCDRRDYPLDRPWEAWLHRTRLWTQGEVTTPQFWRKLPAYPWATALWKAIKKGSNGCAKICSNPGRQEFAFAAACGKIDWCADRLRVHTKDVCLLKDKHLLAGPERVLIDDLDENIDAWNKAGGIGLLFPQPWNSAAAHTHIDPIAWLHEQLP